MRRDCKKERTTETGGDRIEQDRQMRREQDRDRIRQIRASQTDEQREQLCILSYASSKLSPASFDYVPPGRIGR